MSSDSTPTGESGPKPTRRQVIAALGASGAFGGAAVAGTTDEATGDLGIGGGPMSSELSHLQIDWHEGPESDLPEPGAEGRFYRVTSGGSNYSAGDVLRDDGSSWGLINLGVESLSTVDLESGTPPKDNSRDSRLHRTRGRRRDLSGTIYGRPSKACVAFQIDGTRESAYTKNDPYLDNNVPVGLAVTTDRVGGTGYLTWDQIDELVNQEDWTAMNHAKSHTNFDNLGEDGMREEVYVAHRELLDRGYDPTQYVYAGGSTGGDTGKGIVSELYDYAYGIAEFTFASSQAIRPYDLPRKATESQFNSTADLKAAIDDANTNNVAVHFYTHEIIDGTESDEGPEQTSTQKLRDVINYAQNQGVDIHAPDEALRWCAPQMPFGSGGLSKMRMRPDDGSMRTTLSAGATQTIEDSTESNLVVRDESGDWFYSPPARVFHDFAAGGEQWWRDSNGNLLFRILESGTFNVASGGRLNVKGEFELNPKSSAPSSPTEGDLAYSDGSWTTNSGPHYYDGASWIEM